MPPPPPPPPPPICLPFSKKKGKRYSWSESDHSVPYRTKQMARRSSFSPERGHPPGGAAESITFHSDSEMYDEVPEMYPGPLKEKSPSKPKLGRGNSLSLGLTRGNTMTGTKKSTVSSKWGYGWGAGKNKEKELPPPDAHDHAQGEETPLAIYKGPVRRDSRSTQASRSTQRTYDSQKTVTSQRSRDTHRTTSSRSTAPKPRPPLMPQDSTSTLVGSAFERKVNDRGSIREKPDTTERLDELRKCMQKDNLDYYIVPSEDAHQSEYVAPSDKRREYISGFTGTAGQAVITRTQAFLIVDSRYWIQAREQVDSNWTVIQAGAQGEAKDWIEWLVSRLESPKERAARVGIDARMIAHEKAVIINSKIGQSESKLVYPPQNLVDLVWKEKPAKPREPLYKQPIEYTGKDATYKINKIREWVRAQPPAKPAYTKGEASPAHMHVGTLVVSLPQIAYTLNLRGSDIPYNPLFHAYLYIGLEHAILFVDSSKVDAEVEDYLTRMKVERKDYTELWPFLRRRPWGEGKLIISPQTSYAISLMLTNFRYTVVPSFVEQMMAAKNEVEIDGMRRAYLRDGVSFVRFFAWLEGKLAEGYDITEYEAAQRLTEFRKKNKNFMGLAYENISASGPNAALPHYIPKKLTAHMIDRETPYLNDSGGQYRDGTCDTTRTLHFGRPTSEQCEAFTRVLQGHIAIDSAIFPEGTSGHQLDVLARKALWREGFNYDHGTGHGVGSFLTVHEGPHSFSSSVALQPGHVITNEPGYYAEGKFGIRIESALVVKRVQTRGNHNGDIWLGFERLTCVPIQTRMVKESMLTKEEKQWLKAHNQRCWEQLSPLLKEDKRAYKWLEREVKRGFGLAAAPGGLAIEWD